MNKKADMIAELPEWKRPLVHIGYSYLHIKRAPQDWRDTIRIGDVLKVGSGFRVVRDATYKANGYLVTISLTILRRSWTDLPYTVYGRVDLKNMGAEKVPMRYKFKAGSIDIEIWRNIKDHRLRSISAGQIIAMGVR